MARQVTIAAGKNNVVLPNGNSYNAGAVVVLTTEQFARVPAALIPGTIIDNGDVSTPGDGVVNQGVDVAAPLAITSTAPGAAYVQTEAAAVRQDVINLRATVAALEVALSGVGKALA